MPPRVTPALRIRPRADPRLLRCVSLPFVFVSVVAVFSFRLFICLSLSVEFLGVSFSTFSFSIFVCVSVGIFVVCFSFSFRRFCLLFNLFSSSSYRSFPAVSLEFLPSLLFPPLRFHFSFFPIFLLSVLYPLFSLAQLPSPPSAIALFFPPSLHFARSRPFLLAPFLLLSLLFSSLCLFFPFSASFLSATAFIHTLPWHCFRWDFRYRLFIDTVFVFEES